ncbi:MAG TPA: NADH-quinone oxidoreductase subunit M [Bacteroidales bacterium]|nr:NADH-quinone oxidoreductase subunit M [Bacteroidales bacterium]
MILILLVAILPLAGLITWITGSKNEKLSKWILLVSLLLEIILSFIAWPADIVQKNTAIPHIWQQEVNLEWIPQLGIGFHLALDGLSFVMVLITFFIGLLTVLATWKNKYQRQGFFNFNFMLVLTGLTGVFLAVDMFLFYFFWELMLIPMYFLISLWGGEKRKAAAFRFFIFTQAGGLLMLLGILGIYFIHGHNTGTYTFDYNLLLGTTIPPGIAIWLVIAMALGFLVKIPLIPLHTWLPDATAKAPIAGSIILAGLLWNSGIYGIMRFLLPLFPYASMLIKPAAMILGILAILYGAKLAFAQTDLRRLVAYSSISHVGFVIIGLFAFNQIALQGVVMQMLTHSISTAALLILAGLLLNRLKTDDLDKMGGIWTDAPSTGSFGLIFTMSTVGLPGLGNFLAEFLVLLGTFKVNITVAVLAALGLIATVIYALRMIQKIAFGEKQYTGIAHDLSIREKIIAAALVVPIFWLGLFPGPVFKTLNAPIEKTLEQNTGILVSVRDQNKIADYISLQNEQHNYLAERFNYTSIKKYKIFTDNQPEKGGKW